jgi:prepilin-type N-terminal cleavage/methylation domain-containing protein
MKWSARAAGSSNGFTLLEVVLATAILATSVTAILAAYIHSVKQATTARDLTVATEAARNALEEGLAVEKAAAVGGEIPDRPALAVTFEIQPAGEELLADTFTARVAEKANGAEVLEFVTKRAVYIQPAEEPAAEESGRAPQGDAAGPSE